MPQFLFSVLYLEPECHGKTYSNSRITERRLKQYARNKSDIYINNRSVYNTSPLGAESNEFVPSK